MADIELVIKIPEEVYEKIQKRKVNQYDIDDICQSVFEGIPLPKGHGRLIDADALTIKLKAWDINANGIPNYAWKCIREMLTIIEADKVESKE